MIPTIERTRAELHANRLQLVRADARASIEERFFERWIPWVIYPPAAVAVVEFDAS